MMNIRNALLVVLLSAAATTLPADDEGVIDLLFLGHGRREGNGHFSYLYAPMLNATFGEQKVRMSYEEDPDVLNADNLGKFDAVLLYANHDTITPEQEHALIQFVEDGGGFLPVHCASACFENSSAFTELVGGRFESHGIGTFTAKIEPAFREQEIMEGFEAFETWDETYVHSDLADDREVLMKREGEPWTWTRRQGKGRVFYTAYGHDERTWSQAAFHDLILRGILWAVGETKAAANRTLVASLPRLAYGSTDYVQNYENRKDRLRKQAALSVADSEALSLVEMGFHLELFAAEPDIVNPVAFAWDERGRLFVVETVDYPNDVGGSSDRIVICEDTDGDLKADTFKEFAAGLNIPTSIVRVNGGWLVSQQPSFVFLKDTDGDDVADVREEQAPVWGTRDTHAGPSNLKYGLDNKIWGSIGYSQVTSEEYGVFGSGLFRMQADGTEIEQIGQFNNNTWGIGLSEDFEIFGSTANRDPAWHVAIPRRYVRGSEDVEAELSAKIDDFSQFFPITDKVRQVDAFGQYTAGAGFTVYSARKYPKRYWNAAAFEGGPTGHLLGKFFLEKEGSSYKARNRGNLWASVDAWVSPVFAETGPDGQLWVADWYNFIIQHNPTPTKERGGFDTVNGAGNAHENPLRDKEHGRIYRIVYEDSDKDYAPYDLSAASTEALLDRFGDDNQFWRVAAQRKLVEDNRQEAIPALQAFITKTPSVDEVGIDAEAIHALWTLLGLGFFDSQPQDGARVFEAALRHPAASVRKNALLAYPNRPERSRIILGSRVLADEDPQVAIKALLALSEADADGEIGKALHAIQDEIDANDYWLGKAYALAVSKHLRGYFEGFVATKAYLPLGKGEHEVGFILARRLSKEGEESSSRLLRNLTGLDALALGSFLSGIFEGWEVAHRKPSAAEVELANRLVGQAPRDEQMSLALIADRIGLSFDFTFDRETYAAFVAKNTFAPELVTFGDARAGQELYATNCTGCHGGEAEGSVANLAPALAGMKRWYGQTQLHKYLQGLRGTHAGDERGIAMAASLEFMKSDSGRGTLVSIAHLTTYLEGLPKAKMEATTEEGDSTRGAYLYATCVACHGPSAEGNETLFAPSLADKEDWYLLLQLEKFKSGVRGYDPRDARGTQMKLITQSLSGKEAMQDLVAYIKSLGM